MKGTKRCAKTRSGYYLGNGELSGGMDEEKELSERFT